MHMRRMHIAFPIGSAVMLAMMSGPPQRPFLQGQTTEKTTKELKPTRCLERPMRKVVVEKPSQPERSSNIEERRETYCGPTPPDPQDCQTT